MYTPLPTPLALPYTTKCSATGVSKDYQIHQQHYNIQKQGGIQQTIAKANSDTN